jgi:hypothetical protein
MASPIPPLSPDSASLGALDPREYYRQRLDAETRLRRQQTVIDVQPTRVNLETQTQGRTSASRQTDAQSVSSQTLASRRGRARPTESSEASSQRAHPPRPKRLRASSRRSASSPPTAETTLRYAPGGKGQGVSLENSPQTLGMIIDLTV